MCKDADESEDRVASPEKPSLEICDGIGETRRVEGPNVLIGFAVENAGMAGEGLRMLPSWLFLRTVRRGVLRRGGTGKDASSVAGICLNIHSSDVRGFGDVFSFNLAEVEVASVLSDADVVSSTFSSLFI
jgi:hypothetical protein